MYYGRMVIGKHRLNIGMQPILSHGKLYYDSFKNPIHPFEWLQLISIMHLFFKFNRLYNESPVRETIVTNDRWGKGVLCKHGDFLTCSDRYNPGISTINVD